MYRVGTSLPKYGAMWKLSLQWPAKDQAVGKGHECPTEKLHLD